MDKIKIKSKILETGLERLGLQDDDVLFFTDKLYELPFSEVTFHLETAKSFNAHAVYFQKLLNGSFKPQIYVYDFTDKAFSEQSENLIADIQKKIWSYGAVPLACIFFNTEIKIIDCTRHITKDYKPEYLIDSLKTVGKAHDLYNEQFAIKIKSGLFWEEEELKGKFEFKNSAYDTLIKNIQKVTKKLSKELKDTSKELIHKIIVQSILIKYLEETSDENGKKLLTEKYFKKYNNSNSFSDVLRNGKFVDILSDLNKDFNGNVFKWEPEEQDQLNALDLHIVADLLATDKSEVDALQLEIGFPDWRYFEFKFIPVELISRLYEEFLGENKKDKGLYYTPSHLAKLLVDESLPLSKYKSIKLDDFSILDPACGSGIFLVTAFKRLVQIWRLQNNLKHPSCDDLKWLLLKIYGVDKEEQAIMLTSFSLSLALCNELKPIEVIENLRFDDLCENNLYYSDFFSCEKIKNKKFDLVIGNPPFKFGGLSEYSKHWQVKSEKVKIPQGQIALKFLSESFSYLKKDGLVCLIIKSSGLLYNSTSRSYKKALFSNYNVIQILDFTALARNKSLWDNGADVATAAIYVRNSSPDYNKNILHLTFRRTKATKERIAFEIDDYDLHFVDRQTAAMNEVIWKNNLLGGGRIKNLVEKSYTYQSLNEFLIEKNCVFGEGFKEGSKGDLSPSFIYSIPTILTEEINEDYIALDKLEQISKNRKFEKIPNEIIFKAPNIVIKENIGKKRIPIHINNLSFSFQHKIIGISSDLKKLKYIKDQFDCYNDFYRFFIFSCSGQVLVNLNTAILKNDLMKLPFGNILLSKIDKNIIEDVISTMQDFLRHGEKSKALKKISSNKLESVLSNYGVEFSRALNTIYHENDRKFSLTDVIELNKSSLIATVFKYDSKTKKTHFHKDLSKLNIDGLTENVISSQLSVKRIIKLYPHKDTIVFIKPNQYRYWLSLIAYRDADKCFPELFKQKNK